MATPNYAPHQVCPLCAHDDNVAVVPMGPSLWRFTCDSSSHAAYAWETNTAGTKFEGLGGKSEELGLYDDLPRCLEKGEVWVEYGVVEWRYAHRNPKVYAQLIADYGHRSVDPKPYTASSFIASALGRLVDHGLIALQMGPATGYWKYNGVISYWALPPGPAESPTISWDQFSSNAGLDSSSWPV